MDFSSKSVLSSILSLGQRLLSNDVYIDWYPKILLKWK
jgi:hypothetical protein